MTTFRIAIIGAGAIGGTAAAALVELGQDVTLCVRRPILRLIVERDDRVQEVQARIATDPALLSPVDWVLLATKAQDTAATKPWLDSLTRDDTVVAVLQNGIDHIDRVAPLIRQGETLPAVVYSPSEMVAPGRIRSHGTPRYIVPAGAAGAAFARLFEGSGIRVDQTNDFLTTAWLKFLANISANPITALTLGRIGIMLDPDIRRFAKGILSEAVAVGRAAGARLNEAEIDKVLDAYADHDPNGGTSMLFDRMAGRPMEFEHLTGVLVRTAQRLGIDVPLNQAMLALLRGLQASLLKSGS